MTTPIENHIAMLNDELTNVRLDLESKQSQVVRLNREMESLRARGADIEAVVAKLKA